MTIASTIVAVAATVGLTKKPAPAQGLVSTETYDALLAKHIAWARPILAKDAPYLAAQAKVDEVTAAVAATKRDIGRGYGREFIGPLVRTALDKLLNDDLVMDETVAANNAEARANAIVIEFIVDNPLPLGEPTRDVQLLCRQQSLLQKALPILESRRNTAKSAAALRAKETIEAHYAPIVERNAAALKAFGEQVAEELAFCEAMALCDLAFQPIFFSHLLGGNDGITNPSAVAVSRLNEARSRGFID